MMQTQILFDGPDDYPHQNHYPYEGSSPKFVKALKLYLGKYCHKIKSINLALYLFNNLELHHLFTELAKQGILINVVSIPLEGYDNSLPQRIIYHDGSEAFSEKQTKFSIATGIYESFQSKPENYNLFLFSHTYVRSPWIKSFSRGKIPYSLHIKSLLIEFNSGEFMSGLLSSNLAIRDTIKHDTFVLRQVKNEEANSHQFFFNHLIENSFALNEYREQSVNINAKVTLKKPPCYSSTYFMAPFYGRSPEISEKIINDILETAEKRIWIVAQHLSAYKYQIPLCYKTKINTNAQMNKNGILHKALLKGKEGVEIKCISQTFSDNTDNGKRFRKPVNSYNFHKFIQAFKELPNSAYYINNSVHSKYIIVDDTVIISTFNYTPTQFIYLPYVEIDKFQHIGNLRYKGIFSEVGQMIILRKKSETDCFLKNFEYIQDNKETMKVI